MSAQIEKRPATLFEEMLEALQRLEVRLNLLQVSTPEGPDRDYTIESLDIVRAAIARAVNG